MPQKAWIGKTLFGIGIVHSLFGLIFMWSTISVLWNEGLLNTVNGQPDRESVFWFLFTGFLLLILGALVNYLEQTGLDIPVFLGWSLLLLTVIGAVLMPLSGVWLMLIPIFGIFYRAIKDFGIAELDRPIPD